MIRRAGQCLRGNKHCILNVESLEDRRLLSAANLLAGVLPTPPALRSPITSDLAATLHSGVLGNSGGSATGEVNVGYLGSSLPFAGNSGLGGDAVLLLAIDAEVGPGGVGLRLGGGAGLNLGGGAGLHVEVGTYVGLGTGNGLEPEVDVALHLSGGAGVNLGDEDGVDLELAVGAEVGPGGVGLRLGGGAGLNLGGGAGLHVEVGTYVGLGTDNGLAPEVDVAPHLSGAGANLGDEDGVDPQLAVGAEAGPGSVDLDDGADLNQAGGAGSGWSGEPLSSGGLHSTAQHSSMSQGPAVGPSIFGLFGFTGGREGEQADMKAPGDSEPPGDEEALERAALLLLTDLLAGLKAEGLADEPFGVARPHLLPGTGVVQASGGDGGAIALEDADLSPEDAGLLSDCVPFNVLSLEQLLPQFLAWLDDLGEEWAGLGTPPWVLLALVAAAAAGEVARRNLGRWRRSLLDAAFAPAPWNSHECQTSGRFAGEAV